DQLVKSSRNQAIFICSSGFNYINFVAFCKANFIGFELHLQSSQSCRLMQPARVRATSSFRARRRLFGCARAEPGRVRWSDVTEMSPFCAPVSLRSIGGEMAPCFVLPSVWGARQCAAARALARDIRDRLPVSRELPGQSDRTTHCAAGIGQG